MTPNINLENLQAEISDTNAPSDYLPVKTNYNECNWNIVAGYFLSFACGVELNKYSKEDLEQDCKDELLSRQVSEEYFGVLRKAYFETDGYLNLAPKNLLLHTQDDQKSKVNSASKKVATALSTLLGDQEIQLSNAEDNHFIAELISSTLASKFTQKSQNGRPKPYLPFLYERFLGDLCFLIKKPTYFVENIANLLALYNFLHISQLALNLKEWKSGEPSSKPLFFIIENERVSSERSNVIDMGWNSFASASRNLFPILSILQTIQSKDNKKPLWQLFIEINASAEKQKYIDAIDDFSSRFIEARKLRNMTFEASTNVEESIEQLVDLALAQFDKRFADPSTTRYQANEKVVAALKEHTAKGFVKARGRIGNILVLSLDNLLLLTNLIIGTRNQLRFDELIDEFKGRGIYFDESSEEKLIEIFERIGNVERKSDSGDDLNVRQTI
ncbi:DNA phosphorothioation-dependent restriction protein DptG [Alteromonas ponticola]|uniref:DNA phosphorothioation-dependent restriction protein DptG n=1 Tax=Alteromonas aquimaris TaxID=2998417 RepID=A0ABT3P2X7_9ALTE|nr:DNA phosphorothioation-dependent restriction protein DptG [Alteromonas aquimaris]MCW8107124.1 DNA phosphorothioation-dependent restriction protein DptG [Alteromonas aquimaris]